MSDMRQPLVLEQSANFTYGNGFRLFNGTWSQKGHSLSCMAIGLLFLNCKSPDQNQATHRPTVGCQPGDCIRNFNLPQGFGNGIHV